MTDKVGIFRTHEQLQAAVEQLQVLHARSNNIGLSSQSAAVNPELVTAYRLRRMLKLALCVTYGALQRTESRGAHFREDFPNAMTVTGSGGLWQAGLIATSVADPGLRGAECHVDGAAARLAWLWRKRLYRTPRYSQQASRDRAA